jgi:hypothetical protein
MKWDYDTEWIPTCKNCGSNDIRKYFDEPEPNYGGDDDDDE